MGSCKLFSQAGLELHTLLLISASQVARIQMCLAEQSAYKARKGGVARVFAPNMVVLHANEGLCLHQSLNEGHTYTNHSSLSCKPRPVFAAVSTLLLSHQGECSPSGLAGNDCRVIEISPRFVMGKSLA
jgi:hypothetical protein